MSEVIITVRGEHGAWFDAERATLSIGIAHDGPTREPVVQATTRVAAEVTAALAELHDPGRGPVTRWSSDHVRVWSQRPWNDAGAQLPPVCHAAIGATARFSDVEVLAAFVERFAATEGVTIQGVEWDLTSARRDAVVAEVRTAAVADAVAKARVFARAAGLGEPSPIAIADPGMLGDASGGAPAAPMALARAGTAFAADTAAPLSLTPDRIEVRAAVDARFRVS